MRLIASLSALALMIIKLENTFFGLITAFSTLKFNFIKKLYNHIENMFVTQNMYIPN